MAKVIGKPTTIESVGNKPKLIEEFFGRVNSQTNSVSIAKMKSPKGWEEAGQTPEFQEYTIILNGSLRVETKTETIDLNVGEAILIDKNEWVRYSSPNDDAEYIAICLPAFSPDTVNRDM